MQKREERRLVLVYQMCGAVGAVDFFVFAYFAVSFTAHVEHFTSVAVSA